MHRFSRKCLSTTIAGAIINNHFNIHLNNNYKLSLQSSAKTGNPSPTKDDFWGGKESTLTSDYDFEFDINSLRALQTSGWPVRVSDRFMKHVNSQHELPLGMCSTVAFQGFYSRGKTWLINQLCGCDLPASQRVTTKGISLRFPGMDEQGRLARHVFIDTAGTHSPVPIAVNGTAQEALFDRIGTELLLQDVVFDLTFTHVVLCADLTWVDQRQLELLIHQIARARKAHDTTKADTVAMVHNLRNDTIHYSPAPDDVWKETGVAARPADPRLSMLWQEQVLGPYPGGKANLRTERYKSYISTHYIPDTETHVYVEHFLLVDNDTEAGRKYNQSCVTALRDFLANLARHNPPMPNPVLAIPAHASNHLPKYARMEGKKELKTESYPHTFVGWKGQAPEKFELRPYPMEFVSPIADFKVEYDAYLDDTGFNVIIHDCSVEVDFQWEKTNAGMFLIMKASRAAPLYEKEETFRSNRGWGKAEVVLEVPDAVAPHTAADWGWGDDANPPTATDPRGSRHFVWRAWKRQGGVKKDPIKVNSYKKPE